VEQALRMYTFGSAFACFQEREKGRLMKGMLADFIVVDRDIFAVDASEIQDIKVLQTYIGGDLI
jgi:predicted amidohydrolase YtcJ